MNDDYRGTGGGCGELMMYAAIGIFVFMILMALAGGGSQKSGTTNNTTTTNKTNVEVLSRNQVNLFSDVTNCYGDGSCVNETTSTRTEANTTTDNRITGDRNMMQAGGQQVCWDAALNTYTSAACNGGGAP